MTHPPPGQTHALHRHPSTPAGLLLDVSVVMGLNRDGLQLVYSVSGNTAGLRIPPTTAPGPADGLWQHTCLEAFVSVVGEASYREFNFSPSGQWAAYRFASERVRDTNAPDAVDQLSIDAVIEPMQLRLTAHMPWAVLPLRPASLCIALSAVIEDANGHLSYWALRHPCERPDFHHPAGRTLHLALPVN